uniref:uncharacterized protein isoform X2 n=1 Tax=Pristiophorus japonicus TaxID=55135 RepID=UPI00398EFF7F
MLQSLRTKGSQPLNSTQSNKTSAARTSKHLNAETILQTDTPRTRELKTLRAKRLAYFVDPNHNCTNTSASVDSLEANDKRGSFDHNVSNPLRENLINAEQKDSLIEKTFDFNESVQHTKVQDTQKAHHTDLEPSLIFSKSDETTVSSPKPDYNLLENPTVSEIQKLRHILSWAQKILKNSEEVMNTQVCQKASPLNEKETVVSRVKPDTKQPNTFNWSWDTDRSIHAGPLSSRLDGSHYSADTSRSSASCSSLDLLRTNRTLVQTSCLATSLSEEQDKCMLADTGYSSKGHVGPNNIWERSFPEQGNAYRDNVSNNNWKIKGAGESKVQVTQFEFPADENCHSGIGDVGALNEDKYFWIPLVGSSDEEEVTGNRERKGTFMQPFVKNNVTPFWCSDDNEEPTLSARTVTLRKSPATIFYSSADLLSSPVKLYNTTQQSMPTVCDKEKHNYAWEPIEAVEYLSGGYHKTSAEDSEATDLPDVLLNLENAGFNFKSQMDLSVIPRLDLSTLCKETTISPNETISANEKDNEKVSASQEIPSIEQFPERFRNLSVTNANKTLLSYLSTLPSCCSGKMLDNRGTENLLTLENDPLKKEANHNNNENETRHQIIEYKTHSTLKLSSLPLLSSSDSSPLKKSNLQFIKEQSIEREKGQITDENIDSFLHASNLVKFCPECTSGNSSTVNWCMACGCVLIGITPQFCTVSSNVDKISFSNPRGSPKKEKTGMLLTNATAASKVYSDFAGSDKIYGLKYSKVNTCDSSGTCEPELSVYEKYLLYMEHLQKIRGQHRTQEQQSADVLLVKENASQTGVVDESNSYYGKHETEKNNTTSFKVSTCFSDYTERKQIVYEQEPESNSLYNPGKGAIPVEENAEEHCIIPGVSVLQYAPQGKDFQPENYVETSTNIAPRAFLKQIVVKQEEDQNLTSTECENKKETWKDAAIKPRRKKSIQSSLNRYQRCWEKSSIAWSSDTYGEIKPRSTNTNQPRSADDCWRSSKKTPLHADPSNVVVTKSKASWRQLTKRCVSASVLDSKRAPQETPRSKTLLQNTAVASMGTMKSRKTSEYLNNNAFQPCDKLICRGDDDHSLWLYLPDEIWISVFILLPHQDLCQVAQVCHCFRRLANDETLWKTIQIENINCLNDDWLANIGHHQPQSLRLYRCNDRTKSITDSGLRELFRHCKNSLKELNVTSCSGPKLTGDTILLHASAVCRKLTSVDVSWTAATSKGIVALAQASSRLYRLLVNGCQLTDESINILIKKHRTSLRELEVFGCHALSAHCLSYMAQKCPNLQVLNVGRLPKITTACLIQMVTCLKNLIVLNLSGLNAVHDHVVHHIVRQCPKMDRLILSSCPQLTDVSLFEIGTYLPTIRHLDVSGCKKVTDTGVQALAMSCHKLQYLDLSSTATGKWGNCTLVRGRGATGGRTK